MRKQLKREKKSEIEKEYMTIFSPNKPPSQGADTDAESLEQPSELKYVQTTATPQVEGYDLK